MREEGGEVNDDIERGRRILVFTNTVIVLAGAASCTLLTTLFSQSPVIAIIGAVFGAVVTFVLMKTSQNV